MKMSGHRQAEETDSAQLCGTDSEVGLVKESALEILTRAEAEGRGSGGEVSVLYGAEDDPK